MAGWTDGLSENNPTQKAFQFEALDILIFNEGKGEWVPIVTGLGIK